MGIHNNIVKLIVNLYAGQQAAVRLECGMSDWFPVSKGVRQGRILSPHLFILYTEGIMREVEQDSRKDLYNEPNIQGLKLKDLRYADDTALLSTTTEGMHQLIHSVKEHSENKGLFLNIKKTKIVDTDRCKKTSDITVDGETGECLENFEYLESKIEGNGKCSNEIKRRTAMAAGQLKKMGKKIWKGQDKQTKLKIVRNPKRAKSGPGVVIEQHQSKETIILRPPKKTRLPRKAHWRQGLKAKEGKADQQEDGLKTLRSGFR